MAETKTDAASKKDRERDKRYRKAYRIGLDTYNLIGEIQGWKCADCGRPVSDFTVPLQVDHEHLKITFSHRAGGWKAETFIRWRQLRVSDIGTTQKEAKERVLRVALPLSIRGLLCPGRHTGCNRLLGRIDKPEWLRTSLAYLENPPAGRIIS